MNWIYSNCRQFCSMNGSVDIRVPSATVDSGRNSPLPPPPPISRSHPFRWCEHRHCNSSDSFIQIMGRREGQGVAGGGRGVGRKRNPLDAPDAGSDIVRNEGSLLRASRILGERRSFKSGTILSNGTIWRPFSPAGVPSLTLRVDCPRRGTAPSHPLPSRRFKLKISDNPAS